LKVSKILIDAGIDLTIRNKFGFTAQQFAKREYRDDILGLFPPEDEQYQIPHDYICYNRFVDLIPNVFEKSSV